MGALFSKKKKYWVPEHRKLDDLLEDPQRWKTIVDMTGWQLQNAVTERLTSEMIESKGTVEINLSYNGIGDDECEALAAVIKRSKTIKRLVLSNNHIHARGAEALAAALTPETGKDDPPLEVLILRCNSIGDEGAIALAQVMTCNKTLKRVDMYWNNIGNAGLESICNNLRPDFPKDFLLDIRYNGYDRNDASFDWLAMQKKIREARVYLPDDGVTRHHSKPSILGFPM